MKRALTLAALVASISACATGGGNETRRESAATASPAASRPEGEGTTAREPVATSGEGRFSRPAERRARATPPADEHRGVAARDEHRARSGAYTVDGRVAGVGGMLHKSVRIQREGSAPAELRITDDTRVLLDGHEARLDEVHEGDEVRATFELRGETPTATELRVRPGAAAK